MVNTWEKEKLLVTSNFSFSHSVFIRRLLQPCKKQGLVWERVNPLPHDNFWCPWSKSLENISGKGENPGNQHFLLFRQCFLPYVRQIECFEQHLTLCHKTKFYTGPNWKQTTILLVKMIIYVLVREENVGEGENAGYQHFLLFPQCFHKPSCARSLKFGIVW